jgi:hypothetical protein
LISAEFAVISAVLAGPSNRTSRCLAGLDDDVNSGFNEGASPRFKWWTRFKSCHMLAQPHVSDANSDANRMCRHDRFIVRNLRKQKEIAGGWGIVGT